MAIVSLGIPGTTPSQTRVVDGGKVVPVASPSMQIIAPRPARVLVAERVAPVATGPRTLDISATAHRRPVSVASGNAGNHPTTQGLGAESELFFNREQGVPGYLGGLGALNTKQTALLVATGVAAGLLGWFLLKRK